MQPEKESQVGICYECTTKNTDSSRKEVSRCRYCEKWFCKEHSEPRMPHFINWDSVLDIPGIAEFKVQYYIEHKRQGGHPDLVYWRKKLETLEIEEKRRDELINQAIDRMMAVSFSKPANSHDNLPIGTSYERRIWELEKALNISHEEARKKIEEQDRPFATRTYHNKFNHDFRIPEGMYDVDQYYEKLNNARTLEEVEALIDEYRNPHPKTVELPEKKKHWWQ
jgi:hypothetical protein